MNKKYEAFFKNVTSVPNFEPVYNAKGNIESWKITFECGGVNGFRAPNFYGGRLTVWVQTLDKNKKALHRLNYVFRDGLFGRGGERAWRFRINILGQLAKKHNEDIK